jgi:hypothetical protein
MKGRLYVVLKMKRRGIGLLLHRPFGHLMKNGQVAMMSEGLCPSLNGMWGAGAPHVLLLYILIILI